MNRKRGSVLIVAVWMLAILFLLTMSISRRANQELLFVKYSLQKMQARYLAWAGFHYAIAQIRQDSQDKRSSTFDNLSACGVKLEKGRTLENVFKGIPVGNGHFDIGGQRLEEKLVRQYFGMSDEDGKLNLNALNLQNYRILRELLIILNVPSDQALRIAAAALDWRDEDKNAVLGAGQMPEGPFSLSGQEILAKNRSFDSVYELMFLKDMTPEIYERLKDFVTVFPRRATSLKINFATAPREVLAAVARSFSGALTNTSQEDADSLANKILLARAGIDKVDGSGDDQAVEEKQLSLTIAEEAIFRSMAQVLTKTSRFLSIQVTGTLGEGQHHSRINAVVDRETLTVVSWRND